MTTNRWVVCITISFLFCLGPRAYALNPCAGKGTVIVFVNGVFNNWDQANASLEKFQESTQPSLADIPNLKYQLAWVEGRLAPLQLAQTMAQRGVDDFQRYWLWLYGLEKGPSWFDEEVRSLVTDPKNLNATVLPRLNDHLELYSDIILQGYQVIVISHSAGNLYANAALRSLPGFASAALQPTINERHQTNPDYPATEQMIANIQIATPVRDTVNGAPWVSFKDDQIANLTRGVMNNLPGNIKSPGVNASDLWGHSLASYLRVDESRNRIIQHMREAYTRLKYPIPFLQDAATVEYRNVVNHQSTPSFTAAFYMGSQEITTVSEKTESNGNRLAEFVTRCRDLRPGDVDIRAESIIRRSNERTFMATGYIGTESPHGGKPLRMTNSKEIDRWQLGQIRVSRGQSKDPIEADVRYFDRPLLKR
ncbi:MAG: hypothetical protein P4M08_14110 [Oligoflexia bacterium]|nr:hypothetical protein [Oligoflexia bacterium]